MTRMAVSAILICADAWVCVIRFIGRYHLMMKAKNDLLEKDIRFSDALSALEILVRKHTACEWHQSGLPGSCYETVCERSTENVAIALANPRCSLFVGQCWRTCEILSECPSWGLPCVELIATECLNHNSLCIGELAQMSWVLLWASIERLVVSFHQDFCCELPSRVWLQVPLIFVECSVRWKTCNHNYSYTLSPGQWTQKVLQELQAADAAKWIRIVNWHLVVIRPRPASPEVAAWNACT